MKKTLVLPGLIALCVAATSVSAQTPVTNTTPPATTPATTTTPTSTWDPKNNPTVVAITSQFEGKYITPKTTTTDVDIFPAIGKYESSTNSDAASVSIALDPENKGIVWIDGLPQGRVKAMLRKSPAIYKIPAQTADGKNVAEGTLIFDKETNTLSISIGKPFNAEDPAAVFAPAPVEEPVNATTKTSKSKSKKTAAQPKPWTYTGIKVPVETAAN